MCRSLGGARSRRIHQVAPDHVLSSICHLSACTDRARNTRVHHLTTRCTQQYRRQDDVLLNRILVLVYVWDVALNDSKHILNKRRSALQKNPSSRWEECWMCCKWYGTVIAAGQCVSSRGINTWMRASFVLITRKYVIIINFAPLSSADAFCPSWMHM